ncbi:4-hydroxy-3-methylbut-2-en-1-yl diphosphate synthase [Caminibacter sp.]
MSASTLIYIVGLSIVSMAFIFIFLLLKPNKVTREKLVKILGDDVVEKLKAAKDDDERKAIIRSLSRLKRSKLKTLMESQDIRDLLKAIHEHILEDNR